MILRHITLSFTMTVTDFEVQCDSETRLSDVRKAIKQRAYQQFVEAEEPFDDMHIIDVPDYPALID